MYDYGFRAFVFAIMYKFLRHSVLDDLRKESRDEIVDRNSDTDCSFSSSSGNITVNCVLQIDSTEFEYSNVGIDESTEEPKIFRNVESFQMLEVEDDLIYQTTIARESEVGDVPVSVPNKPIAIVIDKVVLHCQIRESC